MTGTVSEGPINAACISDLEYYIALDNYKSAQKLVKNIFTCVERLERHPKFGRKSPELEKSL